MSFSIPRPNATTPKNMVRVTPFARAALDVLVGAGVVVLDEPEAVTVGVTVIPTPTAAHKDFSADIASCRSTPEHCWTIHVFIVLIQSWLLQWQL